MWEKVEMKTFGYCYNQGDRSDENYLKNLQ